MKAANLIFDLCSSSRFEPLELALIMNHETCSDELYPLLQAAAERCGIQRLVDKRFAGIAKGVGTQKIIGRVHMVQIQIEEQFLTSSFSILEDQPMDMLLG